MQKKVTVHSQFVNCKRLQKKTVAFSRDASNLFFHILTKCNLSCCHCYINKEQHGHNILDINTIKQWLSLFAEKTKSINVIFLGGEPTLHPDLFLAVKEAKRLGFKSITIDTNGYLFNDILNKITPDEVDFISFSLDGATRKTNDAIRGKGSFEKCTAGIKKSVAKGFSTSMIYTVSAMNLHELHLMPELVKTFGIDRFFIQVIGIRGKSAKTEVTNHVTVHSQFANSKSLQGAADARRHAGRRSSTKGLQVPGNAAGAVPCERLPNHKILQVTKENWLDIIPKVAEEIAEQGIIVTYPKVFLGDDEKFQCAGLVADNYFIFPNGRVYRCPLCEDFPIHSLEIRDNKLVSTGQINEKDLFNLTIPEGCVMNKMIQPGNLAYKNDGTPRHKIACCMLKQEISMKRP